MHVGDDDDGHILRLDACKRHARCCLAHAVAARAGAKTRVEENRFRSGLHDGWRKAVGQLVGRQVIGLQQGGNGLLGLVGAKCSLRLLHDGEAVIDDGHGEVAQFETAEGNAGGRSRHVRNGGADKNGRHGQQGGAACGDLEEVTSAGGDRHCVSPMDEPETPRDGSLEQLVQTAR